MGIEIFKTKLAPRGAKRPPDSTVTLARDYRGSIDHLAIEAANVAAAALRITQTINEACKSAAANQPNVSLALNPQILFVTGALSPAFEGLGDCRAYASSRRQDAPPAGRQSAMTPTVIRASALSTWPDCERRSAARLFRREIEAAGYSLRNVPRGIGAIIGTVVHSGVEFMLLHKATTGRLPLEAEPQDVARSKLREQVSAGEVLYDTARGVTHRIADAVDQVTRMVLSYQLAAAPQVSPIIAAEKHFAAEVEPSLMLSGHPDLLCREPRGVRELKTGITMPVNVQPQIGGYSLLARSNNLDIERAVVDFVPRVRRHAQQPAPVTKSANLRDAEVAAASIIKRIANAIETFRLGDKRRGILPGDSWSFMANPSSNLCSPKYCSAWGTRFCKEGRPERKDD